MTTRWAPEKKDVMRELATEILHNYARGRVLVAVDAPPGADTTGFAADLVEAVRAEGHEASGEALDAFSARRAEGSGPAVPGDAPDVVHVVDGPGAQREDLRGAWHLVLWLAQAGEARGGSARAGATIVVDAADPAHPRRVYDDAC